MNHFLQQGRAWRGVTWTAAAMLYASPAASFGQTLNNLSGPGQEFVFDAPSMSLRQMAGSPGAAALGAVLLDGVSFASVPPGQTYGIACASGECHFLSKLGSEEFKRTPLADQTETPDSAAWAQDGGVAVLFSRTEQWIRVFRGLPDALQAQQQWSTASLGGTLTAVTISADGQHIALAIAGDHPGVFELGETGTFVPLLTAQNPTALAFAPDGAMLYALDAAEHKISSVDLAAHGPAQSWSIEAVQDPTGVQPGRNPAGQLVVYVTGGNDHALFVFSATSHELVETIPLNFAPSLMQPLGTGNFLLTTRVRADELLWSYAPGRGAFFVPVTPQGPAESSGLPVRRVRR